MKLKNGALLTKEIYLYCPIDKTSVNNGGKPELSQNTTVFISSRTAHQFKGMSSPRWKRLQIKRKI